MGRVTKLFKKYKEYIITKLEHEPDLFAELIKMKGKNFRLLVLSGTMSWKYIIGIN